jgi:ABC-type Fe3+-hydroxamate transport system substrate-binding protein
LVGLAMAAFIVGGCADDAANQSTAGAFYAGTGPDGVRVVVRSSPRRIVAANACAAEFLLALVPSERIAGVPDTVFDGFAIGFDDPDQWPNRVFHRYRGIEILALRPDLVITHGHQDGATTRALRNAGKPVVQLSAITGFEDLIDTIELVARICDAEERGRELVSDLNRRHGILSKNTTRRRLRVVSYANFAGGWTQGGKSTADLLIEMAGMINASAEGKAGENHYPIDIERLTQLDPDLFLVGVDPGGGSPGRDFLRNESALAGLRAIKHGRIVTLPTALWTSSSHHLVTAAEQLAAAVDALKL